MYIPELKVLILSLIESTRGFTEVSYLLQTEIPIMVQQLYKYISDDTYFYNIVNQITQRWGPIYSKEMKTATQSFNTLYLQKEQQLNELIAYTESLPIIERAKKKEIEELSDELASMMNPLESLTRKFSKTQVSKLRPAKSAVISKKRKTKF